jgi:hypothetical protein
MTAARRFAAKSPWIAFTLKWGSVLPGLHEMSAGADIEGAKKYFPRPPGVLHAGMTLPFSGG